MPQNSTCCFSSGVCRSTSRWEVHRGLTWHTSWLAQGTHLTHIFVLSYLCFISEKWHEDEFFSVGKDICGAHEKSQSGCYVKGKEHEGLCAASSECLQRGLLGPQEVSLTETALPCLAQGAVSAGKWHECSVEVDHQCVTEARCGPENLFNIKKTQRNSSSQGQAHI